MTPETEQKIRDLADHLRGSCKLLDDEERALIEESDQTTALFDRLVFCCEECNWWCGEDEYGRKDMHCDECSPTEDDGDDEADSWFDEDEDELYSEDDSDDDDDEDG